MRVTSEPVRVYGEIPPFAVSACDGYAFRAKMRTQSRAFVRRSCLWMTAFVIFGIASTSLAQKP